MVFLLPLFGATFVPNFKFLAYAYRELWPVGKNDPNPLVLEGFEKAQS